MTHPTPASSATIATFFVLPLVPDDGSPVQPCAYFDEKGHRLPHAILDSRNHGANTDFVRIVQPELSGLPAAALAGLAIDTEAHLFAGVARTFDEDLGLPSLFQASGQAMVVPVAHRTRRGMILVFNVVRDGRVIALRPSADPEIQNAGDGL